VLGWVRFGLVGFGLAGLVMSVWVWVMLVCV
jgi:hypothetical protein